MASSPSGCYFLVILCMKTEDSKFCSHQEHSGYFQVRKGDVQARHEMDFVTTLIIPPAYSLSPTRLAPPCLGTHNLLDLEDLRHLQLATTTNNRRHDENQHMYVPLMLRILLLYSVS